MELREIPEDLFEEIKEKPELELEECGETEFYTSDFLPPFDLTLYLGEDDNYYMRRNNRWYKSNNNKKIEELI